MFSVLTERFIKLGYQVSCFSTAKEACAYMDSEIDGQTVGFGGSVTLEQMGLYDALCKHNTVYWHWRPAASPDYPDDSNTLRAKANAASIYISSVNAVAETGEIINIDGNGNRVASIMYGHEKVYLVIGKNKIETDYERALYRARNIAAPLNAKRLGVNTPCAVQGEHCYDCKSPERICRGLSVLWAKPLSAAFEIILIDESLGY